MSTSSLKNAYLTIALSTLHNETGFTLCFYLFYVDCHREVDLCFISFMQIIFLNLLSVPRLDICGIY